MEVFSKLCCICSHWAILYMIAFNTNILKPVDKFSWYSCQLVFFMKKRNMLNSSSASLFFVYYCMLKINECSPPLKGCQIK